MICLENSFFMQRHTKTAFSWRKLHMTALVAIKAQFLRKLTRTDAKFRQLTTFGRFVKSGKVNAGQVSL